MLLITRTRHQLLQKIPAVGGILNFGGEILTAARGVLSLHLEKIQI